MFLDKIYILLHCPKLEHNCTISNHRLISVSDEWYLEKCPCDLRDSMLAVDKRQTFIKSKVIAATEEMLLWWNDRFLSCRAEALCPPPVRPPGSSARSLGVLSVSKSTYQILQLLKCRATPELAAGSPGSQQCRKHMGTLLQKTSSSPENFLRPGGEKGSELVFPEPILIPTWYRNHKLVLPIISVLRWEMYFSWDILRGIVTMERKLPN